MSEDVLRIVFGLDRGEPIVIVAVGHSGTFLALDGPREAGDKTRPIVVDCARSVSQMRRVRATFSSSISGSSHAAATPSRPFSTNNSDV